MLLLALESIVSLIEWCLMGSWQAWGLPSCHQEAQLGAKYEGQVIRNRFASGWSRGVIKKMIRINKDRGEYTVLAAFPDTAGRRDREIRIKLRAEHYGIRRDWPNHHWHMLLWHAMM